MLVAENRNGMKNARRGNFDQGSHLGNPLGILHEARKRREVRGPADGGQHCPGEPRTVAGRLLVEAEEVGRDRVPGVCARGRLRQ